MDILSIGNSFSDDAQRYLHRIARADGFDLKTVNLLIGGCTLSRHYRNMLSEERAYILQVNGENTDFAVSLKEALTNRDWDVITIQQSSRKSPYYDTYQPYLNKLSEYIRLFVPKAKLAVHQTWAYEDNSALLNEEMGYKTHNDMFEDIKKAYNKAAEDIGADFIIPSGELVYSLVNKCVGNTHRDTHHVSFGLGRYALGLLWYSVLSGNSVKDNTFSDFDEEITSSQIKIIKESVEKVHKLYKI